jgi:hypothetical protein
MPFKCKHFFLKLSFFFQTSFNFYSYQWIFIRDTVETLIKPQTEGPTPIMESLNEKITNSSTVNRHFFLKKKNTKEI